VNTVEHVATTPEKIHQLAWGYAAPLIVESALKSGVFDALAAAPATAEALAARSGASLRGLRAVANALVGLGLLSRDDDGCYRLAADAEAFLVSGKPSYLGGLFRHVSTQLIPQWLALNEVVQSGKPALSVNREADGAAFFHEFVDDLFPLNYPAAQRLASALDIAATTRPLSVLDLAAGSGVWGIALAQASPLVRVTAVDWPLVLDATRRMATRFGLHERFAFVGGDLAGADFGTGHDIATLGHILHSEGERRSRALLGRTFEALAPGGTIAIAEFLVDDRRSGPPASLLFAVNMLLHTEEGDTFSFAEIGGWVRDAGFRDIRPVALPGPSPLILATRP
jgi:SAM-dependent methyltransferase